MPSIFKNTRFDPYRNTRSNRSACPVFVDSGSDESIQAPPPQPTTRMGRAVAPIRNKVFVPMRRVTKRVTSKSYFPLVFIWVLFGFLAVVAPALWRNIKREEYYKNNMMNQMYNQGPEAEQARWAYMYNQQGGAAAGNYYGGGNPQGGYYGAAGAQGGYYGAAGAQGGYYGGEPGGYYGGNAAGGYYNQEPQEMEQYWRNNVDFNGCKWYQLNCQASYNQRGFESNPSWYSGWGNNQNQNQNQAAAYQDPEAARRAYYYNQQQPNNLGALYFVYFAQLILFILLLIYGFRVITKNLPRGGLIGMLLLWSILSFLMMWLLADNSISHGGVAGSNFFDQFSVLMFMTDFWYMLFGFAFALILGVLCRRVVQRPLDPTNKPVAYQAYEEPKPVAQAPAVAQCPAAVLAPAPAPAPAVVSTPTGPRDPVAQTPPQSPVPSDDFVRVV